VLGLGEPDRTVILRYVISPWGAVVPARGGDPNAESVRRGPGRGDEGPGGRVAARWPHARRRSRACWRPTA